MQKNINIKLNKNIKELHLEELGDATMNTFSVLVGRALSTAAQGEVFRTDNNTDINMGKTWYTCKREIPTLIKELENNPSYFKDFNITRVVILDNEQYERRIRKNFHIDEMSLDYMHNHVPHLKDIMDEQEQKKKQQIYMDAQGDFVDPLTVKREIQS
jgi:hypothetical protein